jgi:hypothetical protein
VAVLALVGALTLRGALGKPTPAPPPQELSAARDRVVTQARAQLDGPLALPPNANPRDVLKGILEDLTAVLKRSPDDDEVRLLRARAARRAGEHLAAADDLTHLLARDPKNVAAATERLLANYQLYVLYLGNLDEPLLRPPCLEPLRDDLQLLRERGDESQQKLAELVDALARQEYVAAAALKPPAPPPGGLPDWAMLQADALLRATVQAYEEEQAAADEVKAQKKDARAKLASRAQKVLHEGLAKDPNHVGLLFLKANSFHHLPDWYPGDNEDRDAAMRRYKTQFETTCDRLRRSTLRGGCDTAVARAVLLSNFGRDDQALDQVQDALSDRPSLPYLHTFRAWLRLQTPADATLTAEEVDSILRDLQPAFETPPDDFNPWFVRALLQASAGRWDYARRDLRDCQKQLGQVELPTSVAAYTTWLKQAQAATTEYLFATYDVLGTLSVPAELRLHLGEELLQRLADASAVAQDGLDESRVRDLKGWTHFHQAQVYAEKEDKASVLREARETLQLGALDLMPKNFREDGILKAWNEDAEFQALYAKYEKP